MNYHLKKIVAGLRANGFSGNTGVSAEPVFVRSIVCGHKLDLVELFASKQFFGDLIMREPAKMVVWLQSVDPVDFSAVTKSKKLTKLIGDTTFCPSLTHEQIQEIRHM